MFEDLGLGEMTARTASVLFALGLGGLFGVLAQRTRFCFRRGLVQETPDRRAALGVWMMALAVAILGTQAAVTAGLISFQGHRFLSPDLPVLAILLGGLAFGAGMVLTRGCVSRLTVLGASGNLRALIVLAVFAIVAHATLKGVLAPLRTTLGSVTLPLGDMASLSALPGGSMLWSALLAASALGLALRSGASRTTLVAAAALGALVPLGWVGTGFVLFDDFDPIALESLSFTAPWTEALFWSLASSSIAPGFGTGLVGGVLAGAGLSALATREFRWESFESPAQTGRYMAGAVLMGIGGVLAGGCTVGAGLAGIPTLSLAALLALAAIAAGAVVTDRVLNRGPGRLQGLHPAE